MYYTYSDYLKNKYHEKVYKLPVNLPVTCPNRLNGACGCDFCAEQGTGFEDLDHQLSVTEQLTLTREKIEKKYHAHKKDFYLQAIIHIQKCIEDLFEIKVEIIEFRSIVDYIKNYKENEVDVHGELVMNNGRKAKLDSSKINGQYQKPLFIGDFKQFLKNPDNEA